MALFLNLYVGHLLGDFLFQPGRLVVAKREGVPGLLTHALIIGLTTATMLIGELDVYWSLIPLVMAAHLAIEELTIALYLNTSARGIFVFVFDQALHVGSLLLLVIAVGATGVTSDTRVLGFDMPLATMGVASAVLTVMLFGSILSFEASNLGAATGKGRILAFDVPRVAGMAERGAALLAAIVVGNPVAGVPVFVPRVVFALRAREGERLRMLVEGGSGLALCVLMWWVVQAMKTLHGI